MAKSVKLAINKMDIFETIQKRRSVRDYSGREIEEEKLKKILEVVRMAPSAKNLQDYKFIVVREAQIRKRLAAAAGQNFIGEAPVIVAAVSLNPDYVMSCGILAFPIDLAIAMDHLQLAAAAEGLGTCWIGAFSQEEVKSILRIPENCKVVTIMPLGYPADQPRKKQRKSLEELISYDGF